MWTMNGKTISSLGAEHLPPPSLINILRKSLTQIEQNVEAVDEDPAVSELRKQVARSVGELELVKTERRNIARKMFLVSPRPYRAPAGSNHLEEGAGDPLPLESEFN